MPEINDPKFDQAAEEINEILNKYGIVFAIKTELAFKSGQWVDTSQIVFVNKADAQDVRIQGS